MPTIAAAVRGLPVKSVILDGELVAVDARGKPVFYELPAAIAARPTRVTARLIYFAFDLLYLDGYDLRGAPLLVRKQLLEALLDNARGLQLIRYVQHLDGDGALILEHVCQLDLEARRYALPLGQAARVDQNEVPGVARGQQRSLRKDGEVAVTAALPTPAIRADQA